MPSRSRTDKPQVSFKLQPTRSSKGTIWTVDFEESVGMMAAHDTTTSPHCLMTTPPIAPPADDVPTRHDCHVVTLDMKGLACDDPGTVRVAVATEAHVKWLQARDVLRGEPGQPPAVVAAAADDSGDALAPMPSALSPSPSGPPCLLGDARGAPGSIWAFGHGKSYHDGRENDLPDGEFEPTENVFEFVLDHRRGEGEFRCGYESVSKIHGLPKEPLYVLAQLPDGSVSVEVDAAAPHWCPRELRHVLRAALKPAADPGKMKAAVKKARQRMLFTLQSTEAAGKPINILVCGEPGVGKSSGINTFCTATAPGRKRLQDAVEKANVRETPFNNHGGDGGGDGRSCHTKTIRQYLLPKTTIHMWDMFGMQTRGPKRYIDKWERLMSGRYRPGYRIDDGEEEQGQYRVQGQSPKWEERVHAALVFVSATDVLAGDDAAFDTCREFITKCNELKAEERDGIPYLVVLTKVDKIGSNALIAGCREDGFDICKVYANAEVYSAARVLSARTGCPLSRVVPMQNYSSDTGVVHLDLALELQPLRALARVVELVRTKWPARFGDSAAPSSGQPPKGAGKSTGKRATTKGQPRARGTDHEAAAEREEEEEEF